MAPKCGALICEGIRTPRGGTGAKRVRILLVSAATLLGAVLGGTRSHAAHAAGIDLDFFKPTTASTGTFCEENGLTIAEGHLEFGANGGYAHRPLVRADQRSNGTSGDVVRDRITTTFLAAYGVSNWLDLGIRVAAVARQVGVVDVDIAENGGVPQRPATSALGDTDLLARVALVRVDGLDKRVRLTLLAPVSLPSGRPDALTGSGNFSFRPRLIAGWHWARLSVSGSAGFAYTRPVEVAGSGLVVGKALLGGLSVAYALIPEGLWLQGETSAALGLELSQTGVGSLATQMIIGARAALPGSVIAQAGVGTGLTHTVGSPRLAAMVGLSRAWTLP